MHDWVGLQLCLYVCACVACVCVSECAHICSLCVHGVLVVVCMYVYVHMLLTVTLYVIFCLFNVYVSAADGGPPFL